MFDPGEIFKRYYTLKSNYIYSLPIVILMPHSRCNCKCVMCDIWKGNKNVQELSERDVNGMLDSFKKLNTKLVAMSGGEALMHPNFFKLCEIIKSKKIRITILSTGLLLKKYVQEILDNADEVIVSLDGSKEAHDKIRNIPDAYNKLKEGIQELKKRNYNFRVTARCVIQKENFYDLPNIVDAAKEIGLDQISFLTADITTDAFNRQESWNEEKIEEVSLSLDELNQFNTKLYPELNQSVESLKKELQKFKDKYKPTPPPINAQGIMYFDFSGFENAINSCMIWSPKEKVDLDKLDKYLEALFAQMIAAGLGEINLSFAQVGDLDALLNGKGNGSVNDVLLRLMTKYPDAFKRFIQKAHEAGLKVNIAFGGANAAGDDYKMGGDPKEQAKKVAEFMDKWGIDGVDFDLESGDILTKNSPEYLKAFFTELHKILSAQGKEVTWTVMGGIQDWPKGILKSLFYDDEGNRIFSDMFDGVNLMLYSSTQYYLDADNQTWGIEQWIDVVGKENAGKIRIGFEDGIDYSNPSSSAGGHYNIDTKDSGKAAGEIYKQILDKLKEDGYDVELGSPFFWPDFNYSRYGFHEENGTIIPDFDTSFEDSFNKEIQS